MEKKLKFKKNFKLSFSPKIERQHVRIWASPPAHVTAGIPWQCLKSNEYEIHPLRSNYDVCWGLPGWGRAKKWDKPQSTKRVLRQNFACFFRSYCLPVTSTRAKNKLLSIFKHFCNSRRTKRFSFSIAQKQHSVFVFRHRAELLQWHRQNIICLRPGCFQADECLTTSVDHYGKRTTSFDRISTIHSFFLKYCNVIRPEKRRYSLSPQSYSAVRTWAKLSWERMKWNCAKSTRGHR